MYIKYLILLAFIVSLGFLYGFSSKRNQQKKVHDIVIEFEEGENSFLTHSMVNKLLIQNQKRVKNQAKSVIDLYRLENTVLTNPYIKASAVFMSIDGTLKSTVKQREAIVRVISKNGSYYVDKQGVVFPLSNSYSARVPLVTGVEKDQDLKEVIAAMQLVLADDFLRKEIVGIHKSDAGNYLFSVRSGNYKVEFGKLEKLNTKFKKLKAFYNQTFLDNSIHDYKTINLKYNGQVVCTK
jgi:cell division protein FtsQ